MTHKLAVFDWNGTILADSRPSWAAGNECLEWLGYDSISYQDYLDKFTFPVIHFYKKVGCSVDHILKHKEGSNRVFQDAYDRLARGARTRRGARTLLEQLNEAGVSCIILSNYLTPKIEEHLARLKMRHLFHAISAHECDGTTILESTSKTERLSAFMAKRSFRPQDTVIIGDTMEEPEIARHLGLTSIGITDGYISEARLRAARPDYVVSSLSQVKNVILSASSCLAMAKQEAKALPEIY